MDGFVLHLLAMRALRIFISMIVIGREYIICPFRKTVMGALNFSGISQQELTAL